MKRHLLFVLLAASSLRVQPLSAQGPVVQTAISRDSIRVGDPFRAVLRITLPAGAELVLPDSLPATDDIENAGKMRMRRDSTNGSAAIIAAYPLTAWRPGQLPLPDLSVLLKSASGERTIAIRLPTVSVLSVLPADTSNIQPKPAKDVLGGNRLWWPWLLLALLVLIALGLLYWWWRRRKRAPALEPVIPMIMPREKALEELDRIRKLGLLEEGAYKRFYTLTTEVLRQYMATVDHNWGTDLTTDELGRKVRGTAELRPAITVLRNADLVKFAKHTPDARDAAQDFARAQEFVRDYPPPVIEPAAAEGKAA